MNNDLISREALKKEFEKVYPLSVNEMGGIVNKRIYDIIDNAPAVTDHSVEIAQKSIELGRRVGRAEEAIENQRPQGELKEYKPLELDYNVKSAVENLKTAYWSNDYEKYAKVFTEAEEIIINAICHDEYIVMKRPQGEWVANPLGDYVCNKCSWIVGKFERNFCPNCGAKMKGGVQNDL